MWPSCSWSFAIAFNEHNANYKKDIFGFYLSLFLFNPVLTKYFVFVSKAPFLATLQRLKTFFVVNSKTPTMMSPDGEISHCEFTNDDCGVLECFLVLFVFIAGFLGSVIVWKRKSLRNETLTRLCPIFQIASFRRRTNVDAASEFV